jgi:hypothetical protein
MPTLLPHRARFELARSVYRDIVNSKDYWYAFVSRIGAWADDAVPPALEDSREEVLGAQRDMLFLKSVRPIDAVYLARRIDWAGGTVYDRYDSEITSTHPANSGAKTLADADFYVLTNNNRVYKCLDNAGATPSLVKPTTVDPVEPERPSDGYVWKFMFELPAQDVTRFLTSEYIPVRYYTAETDFDTNSFVNGVTVTSGGSGYTTADAYIVGDGIGAVVRANIVGGVIASITVVQQGYGYSHAEVHVLGNGTGAAGTVQLLDGDINEAFGYSANTQVAAEGSLTGAIFSVEIVDPGSDYVLGETLVSIVGDGQDAVITVTGINEGAITQVSVASEGAGYSFADLTVIGQSTGFGAVLRPILSPAGGHGAHAPKELFATTLGIQVVLDGEPGVEFAPTVFRQVGLLKNPKVAGSDQLFRGSVGTTCYKATVTSAAGFTVGDSVITNDGGLFTVVQKSGNTLWLLAIIPLITSTSTVQKNVVGSTPVAINTLVIPDVDKLSGEVMYLSNRVPITRSSNQDEIVQVFLRF